jgi:hypothetical protein
VRHIPVTQGLQQQMSELFGGQRGQLLTDIEPLEFTGSYTPDDGEILSIDNFEVPNQFWQAVRNPTDCQKLVLGGDSRDRIKGIFAGRAAPEPFLSFQAFEQRRLLSKGLSLIISQETFKRLEDPGLILADKLTVLYSNGRLYFRSYFSARRVLDLSEYYRQAKDQDRKKFAEYPKILVTVQPLGEISTSADSPAMLADGGRR